MELPSKTIDVRMNDGSILTVKMEYTKSNTVPTVAQPVAKATQPANPAFERALRARPVRIGLRYIGD